MRYFIGIELPDLIKKELIKAQQLLKKEELFSGTYVVPENLHITLVFLGKLDKEELSTIRCKLGKIEADSFSVQLGILEAPSSARVLWATIESEKLKNLHEAVVTTLPEYKEKRPYTGHATIARIKKVPSKPALKEALASATLRPLSWEIESFSLYSSITHQEGPEYTILDTFSLS